MSTTFTQMADGFGKSTSGSGSLSQVLTSTQSQTVSHDEVAGLLGQVRLRARGAPGTPGAPPRREA